MALVWLGGVVLFAGVVGNASADEVAKLDLNASDEAQVVQQRASAYWEQRVARSKQVYDYYAPPELGGPTRRVDTAEFGNVYYKEYAIRDVRVEGDRAYVNVEVRTELKLDRPVEIPDERLVFQLNEEWNLIEGTWYKKPVPRGLRRRRKPRPEIREMPVITKPDPEVAQHESGEPTVARGD